MVVPNNQGFPVFGVPPFTCVRFLIGRPFFPDKSQSLKRVSNLEDVAFSCIKYSSLIDLIDTHSPPRHA